MSFQVRDVQTGAVYTVADAQYQAYASDPRYQVLSAPGGGGGAAPQAAASGPQVDPTIPYEQWYLSYLNELANTRSGRTNAEAAMLGAQTGAFNAQTNQLGTLGGLFAQMRGNPANWANFANLMRGRSRADYPAFLGALGGLTNGLNYASIPQGQLHALNFRNAGFGSGGGGGGGGGDGVFTAAGLGTSGVGGGDPVSLPRINGSRDYDGQGYQNEGEGAIGNPRRSRGVMGSEGQVTFWWDQQGNPVYGPDYDGPAIPRMPRNQAELAEFDAYMAGGGWPSYDAANAPEGAEVAGAAAASDQGHTPGQGAANSVAADGGSVVSTQAGSGFNGESTTVVAYSDGRQVEYRDRDGATVSHGAPNRNRPEPANIRLDNGAVGGSTRGSANPVPPSTGARWQDTAAGQAALGPLNAIIARQKAAGQVSEPKEKKDQPDSGNTNSGSGGGKTGSNSGTTSGPGGGSMGAGTSPGSSGTKPPTQSSPRRRAMGGADVMGGPTSFAEMGRMARGGDPSMPDMGSVRIVTEPTLLDQPGPDDVLTGEPQPGAEDGGDELVLVIPLENPEIGVEPWVADLANQQAGEQRYSPRPGPMPAFMQSLTAGLRGGSGQPPMLAEGERSLPPMGFLDKGPTPMAAGGAVVYDGPTVARPISMTAKLNPGNKPWELTKEEKKLGLYPEGKYVSESGMVQAPSDKAGEYRKIPQAEAVPVPDPLSMPARAAREVLKNPLEMQLLDSILRARGGDPDSFWASYFNTRPTVGGPAALGVRRGW